MDSGNFCGKIVMIKFEITPAMLASIKSKAERTPPGPVWYKEEGVNLVRNSEGWRIAKAECEEDAEHIASADPWTVVAIVDEIERLRSELAKRPVVYCLRSVKTGRLEMTGQSPDVYTLHHAKQWSPYDYSYEPYEGQQS